jgi:hypothetical protein
MEKPRESGLEGEFGCRCVSDRKVEVTHTMLKRNLIIYPLNVGEILFFLN